MVCRHGVSIINVQFLFIYWGTQYFLHVENAASFFPFLFIVLLFYCYWEGRGTIHLFLLVSVHILNLV